MIPTPLPMQSRNKNGPAEYLLNIVLQNCFKPVRLQWAIKLLNRGSGRSLLKTFVGYGSSSFGAAVSVSVRFTLCFR